MSFTNSYLNKMKELLFGTFKILLVTTIIGLALSYATQLLDSVRDLNFLEAVGVYCLWIPIHEMITTMGKGK